MQCGMSFHIQLKFPLVMIITTHLTKKKNGFNPYFVLTLIFGHSVGQSFLSWKFTETPQNLKNMKALQIVVFGKIKQSLRANNYVLK